MLRPANQNTRYCYEKALEAGQRVAAAREQEDREFWLERERHWLHLATSYDYQQRLSAFIAELRGLPKRPFCSVARCPCGRNGIDAVVTA